MKVKSESEVAQSCPTLSNSMDCTAHQAPPSMGYFRQEYWSGVPLPSPNMYNRAALTQFGSSLVAQMIKNACNAGDPVLIPWSGRSLGEGNGNPLQYSCLEDSMDRGAWLATVHGINNNWTQLRD